MKFTLFNIKIEVSFLFCALLCLLLLTDKTGLIIPVLLSSFLHETGHLLCMWAKGIAPEKIRLIPASVEITEKNIIRPYSFAVSLCGPLLNLAVFLALFINYSIFKNRFIGEFAAVNLIIGLFNLLPVKNLDGGEILFNLLLKKMPFSRAENTVFFISIFLSSVLLFFGSYMFVFKNFNISIIILSLYLFICALSKK